MNFVKQLKDLPSKPGIYKFKDSDGQLLYVGKAKNLKSRIQSYFSKTADLSPAKKIMIDKIKKIEYTIVSNEAEALLLEANLIKEYQPLFNVVLKDDKSWLYLKITDDEFPQIVAVRKIEDPSTSLRANRRPKTKDLRSSILGLRLPTHFGPYTSSSSVRQTMKLLRKIFPYFTDKGPMIELGKKTGSPYHLGRYLNQKIISQTEWQKFIKQIINFLSGKTEKVLINLRARMNQASQNQEYELAAHLRDQIKALEKIVVRQKVISHKKESEDYLNVFTQDNLAVITLFKVRQGKLIDQLNFALKNVQIYNKTEILELFANQYYSQTTDSPRILILPKKPSSLNGQCDKGVAGAAYAAPATPLISSFLLKKVKIPQRGNKKKLLDLALTNAKYFYQTQLTSWEKKADELQRTLTKLKKILQLKKIPQRIEAYDISNIQGVSATGSMVVFTNGLTDKNEYRRFSIKTVKGANDPAMIGEIVKRRFQHQEWAKPDLILIDGGLTQLNAARRFSKNIPIISLAKREEVIYLPNQKTPLYLSKKSTVLQLLQRFRDEAHRFAIAYHRKLRKKELIS